MRIWYHLRSGLSLRSLQLAIEWASLDKRQSDVQTNVICLSRR